MVSHIVSRARRYEEIALSLLDLQRLGLQRRKYSSSFASRAAILTESAFWAHKVKESRERRIMRINLRIVIRKNYPLRKEERSIPLMFKDIPDG